MAWPSKHSRALFYGLIALCVGWPLWFAAIGPLLSDGPLYLDEEFENGRVLYREGTCILPWTCDWQVQSLLLGDRNSDRAMDLVFQVRFPSGTILKSANFVAGASVDGVPLVDIDIDGCDWRLVDNGPAFFLLTDQPGTATCAVGIGSEPAQSWLTLPAERAELLSTLQAPLGSPKNRKIIEGSSSAFR